MSISELYRAVQGGVGISPSSQPAVPKPTPGPRGPSEFQALLEQQSAPQAPPRPAPSTFNLSQHAETRIKSRAIPWNDALEKRISGGIDAAHAKGSREALILADDLAVIANVKSRTVITAMDRNQMKEKIFTNIDSAVLV